MGMGGGGGPQTVTNKTELPAWLEAPIKENIQIATDIGNKPYEAYGGTLTAGFSPEQQQAFQYAQSGVGYSMPAFEQAMKGASSASSYTPQSITPGSFLSGNVGEYMNPYTEGVINRTMNNIERQTQNQLNQNADAAIRSKAFGGSRAAITDAVTRSEAARQAGDVSAQLYNQNFQQAAALQAADQERAMQAARANQAAGLQGAEANLRGALALGQVGQQAGQQIFTDAGVLENIGQKQQAMTQQQLDEAYARYQAEKNYPTEMLNLRIGATSSVPGVGTQTQTSTGGGGGGSNFLTGLGAAGTAAMGFAKLLPLLGVSDEREKTDIKKIGKDKESGLTMYSYRYKGDPKSYPKVTGPMAQEVEKKYPEQVTNIAGRKAVNLGFGPMKKAMGA